MDNICKVCNKEFPSEANLHKHIKVHKILIAEYYQTYWPRYDKYDGKIIRYRNKEQYFSTDFNFRDHLRLWIRNTDKATVRAYCKMLLELRINKKKLIWTPCQVELRTTMMPPIQCYHDLFGDYYALCEEMGLKNRFSKGAFFQNGLSQVKFVPLTSKIYVDTRERKPLEFHSFPTEEKTLKFGDYASDDDKTTCGCVIERKSPQDFVGTFSGGFERFCRELDRSVTAQGYVVVLCEDTLAHVLDFNQQPLYFHKNTRINPEFIFHNVRDIIQKYPNVQFLFVDGRVTAAHIIEKIFRSSCTYKEVDLQYLYDSNML